MEIRNVKRKAGIVLGLLVLMILAVPILPKAATKDQYNISSNKDKPVSINLNQTITGPMWVYEQWYSFTAAEAIDLSGIYASERGWIEIYNSKDQKVWKEDSDKAFSFALEADTYKIRVIAGGSNEYYVGKEYSLTLKATAYNWGNLKINWNINNLTAPCGVPFSISIEGSPNTYIFNAGDGRISCGDRVGNGWKGSLSSSSGYNILEVTRYASGYGLKTDTFEYIVKPKTATVRTSMFKVTGTTATVDVQGMIQMKQGNKWVSVPTTQAYANAPQVIKGLKPDKAYTFRSITYATAKGKPTIYGAPSAPVTIVTPTKKKVSIKSVKASGFKTKYVKREYVGGHFNVYGRWIGGHYEGGYYYTTYKLKVKLKKKVPGLKTKFLYINGKKCKVKGKNYVITQGYRGKRSKKKIKVSIYTAKDEIYQAYGRTATKKVTIR